MARIPLLFCSMSLVSEASIVVASLVVSSKVVVLLADDAVTADVVKLSEDEEEDVGDAETDETLVRGVV